MHEEVRLDFHKRFSSPRLTSFAGRGLPERMRSTAFVFLGLTAAAGLALVAIFAQLSFPLLSPEPLPTDPQEQNAVAGAVPLERGSKAVALGEARDAVAELRLPAAADPPGSSELQGGKTDVRTSPTPVSTPAPDPEPEAAESPPSPAPTPAPDSAPATSAVPTTVRSTPAPEAAPAAPPAPEAKPASSKPSKPKAKPAKSKPEKPEAKPSKPEAAPAPAPTYEPAPPPPPPAPVEKGKDKEKSKDKK